jgi:hypothetical protein
MCPFRTVVDASATAAGDSVRSRGIPSLISDAPAILMDVLDATAPEYPARSWVALFCLTKGFNTLSTTNAT